MPIDITIINFLNELKRNNNREWFQENKPRFQAIQSEAKGFYEEIKRPELIQVTYQDLEGETQTYKAEGLMAVCVQHEIDHLDGKLFVDYLSNLKRDRIRNKLEKN